MKVLSLILSLAGLLTIFNAVSYGQVVTWEERKEYDSTDRLIMSRTETDKEIWIYYYEYK